MSRIGEARCGTPSGYRRHQARAEKPCDACVRAKSAYDARWRSAPKQARLSRLSARAQGRASVDLRRAHPDEYQALYQQHRARLLGELAAENGGQS